MNLKNSNKEKNTNLKKVFSAEIMYGDADFFDDLSYITEDKKEIDFITYFLENYTDSLFEFYVRPDLLEYNNRFKNDLNGLLTIVNTFGILAKPLEKKHGYKIDLVTDSSDIMKIHQLLSDCIDAIECLCNWTLRNMNEPGSIENYSIEDITGKKAMTKAEVTSYLKKMGINIFITD